MKVSLRTLVINNSKVVIPRLPISVKAQRKILKYNGYTEISYSGKLQRFYALKPDKEI
jgi:hypothetical protein